MIIRLFQSTRPLRGATFEWCAEQYSGIISIHAPLAGRDPVPSAAQTWAEHFNPRAPCGARPNNKSMFDKGFTISIHAPLAGRD